MKRKILVLMLVLCSLLVLTGCCFHKEWYAATCTAPKTCVECGETEGEALGHSWVDATCAAPKTCTVCKLTEGEALDHTWVDATTEAPKTCTLCAATEGERIITDPRFTTAATKELQGSWVGTVPITSDLMGIEGLDATLEMEVTVALANDGSMTMTYATGDLDPFIAALKDLMVDSMYAEFAKYNYTAEQADALVMGQHGMTMTEYAAKSVDEMDVAGIFEATLGAMEFSGFYYVEGGQFYDGLSWEGEFSESEYTLDGDTFTLFQEIPGFSIDSLVFTRVAE